MISATQTSYAETECTREELFAKQVKCAYKNSSYWREIILDSGINMDNIRISDLSAFPVMEKADIEKYNSEMQCCSDSEISEIFCTSGTTSQPVIIPLTENDLNRLAEAENLSIKRTGATEKDLFQICTTLDKQFMAGIAYYLGIRKIGSGVIRTGINSVSVQWQTIMKLRPSYLIAVPSFIVKMLLYAEKEGIDVNQTSVRKIICIGENIRNSAFNDNPLASFISERWNVNLYSTYAATEMATSFTECEVQSGGHLNSDHLILEVLDDNNSRVSPGCIGELVITTLGVEGMPLFRYRTGDIVFIKMGLCPCGSSEPRVSPVIGRVKQRLKYKGTTIYPSAICTVLDAEKLLDDYLILVENDNFGNDSIRLVVPEGSNISAKKIMNLLRETVRVSIPVEKCGQMASIKRRFNLLGLRKPRKVIDLRN